MKNLLSKNKNKQVFSIIFSLAILFQILLFSMGAIHSGNNAHADGLTPQDSLLLKVLKSGFKKCIEGGVLTKKEIKNSNISREIIFNTTLPIYVNDKTVLLPFKYGTANTINDGDISCQQLFHGYNVNEKNNVFNTFAALGGLKEPPYYNSTTAQKNSFIEALGYKTEDRAGTQLYCAALNYTATTDAGTGTPSTTNSICLNIEDGKIKPSQGNKITSNDVVVKNTTSDKYISLSFDSLDRKISVNMDLSELPEKNHCKYYSKGIYSSPSLDKYIGKAPEEFFSAMFSEIESKHVLNEAKASGFQTTGNGWPCNGDTFPKEIGVKSVVTNSTSSVDTGSGVNAGSGTEINNSLTKNYTYNGSPDYDKLMKYYLPSYSAPSAGPTRGSLDYELYGPSSTATQTGGFTAVERAYNWYYVLKNIFDAISVDDSVGCSTTRPSNGVYLQYLKKSESDPNKTEVQYCPMNEGVLDLKSNEVLMQHETNGKGVVNAADATSDIIRPQTAREVLNNLNSISLPAVCAADSNFPLCKATPIDCKTDPNKDGCKELAGNASEEEDSANGESAACFANAGALGWIICPLIYTLRDAAQGIFSGFIEPLLRVHDSIIGELTKNNESSTMYQAWSFFRNIGNILFVIALLFVIFSQVTGFGIDNYGIKKILPKLIVTAIIVNFSYIICGILVDISNILGNSIKNIFESVGGSLTAGSKSSDGLGPVGYITSIVAIIGTIVAAGAGVAVAGSIISSGGLLTILVPILTFLASAVIAGFFAMLMLGIRQALVIIMIVISPIAFVLYAIPNTNAIFRRWFTLFRGLLTLYPVYCLMVGGGFMAANLIVHGSNEFYLQLVAGLISIAPYFAVPTMTKNAMKGFDAAIGGIATLRSRASSGLQYANKKVTGSDSYKASVANREFGKQSKFAKKYEGYTQEQLSNMKPAQRRRLMNAIGVLGKDAQQAATLGAAMSQYKYNTDTESMKRAGYDAMTAEDENQVKSLQSQFTSENRTAFDALARINELQDYNYNDHSIDDNRKHDLEMRALQRHLLSTKEGQKMYNSYLKGDEPIKDINLDGTERSDRKIIAGKTSDRAKAVLARDFISNNSNLKDKFGIMHTQMQSMQGSGEINNMNTEVNAGKAMSANRVSATNGFIRTMDAKDMQNLSKRDAEEISDKMGTFEPGQNNNEEYKGGAGKIDEEAAKNVRTLSRQVVNNLTNDPTKLGDFDTSLQNLVSTASGTDINNLANRTMEIRDSSGNITHKIVWERPGQGGQGDQGGS